MPKMRPLLALPLILTLSACMGSAPAGRAELTVSPQDTVLAAARPAQPAGPRVMQARYDVTQITIDVPRSLKVSEANVFYPIADIVWRGEPHADRYLQVQKIFQDAALAATTGMDEGRKVTVALEVTRFHCLTEKTRYTVGGTHSLKFMMTLRDAETGAVLDGPREVVADIKASGGGRAIAEEEMGLTQRVVIVDRLTQVIRRELSGQVSDPALVAQALMAVPPSTVTITR